jgi:hypothetical protein
MTRLDVTLELFSRKISALDDYSVEGKIAKAARAKDQDAYNAQAISLIPGRRYYSRQYFVQIGA